MVIPRSREAKTTLTMTLMTEVDRGPVSATEIACRKIARSHFSRASRPPHRPPNPVTAHTPLADKLIDTVPPSLQLLERPEQYIKLPYTTNYFFSKSHATRTRARVLCEPTTNPLTAKIGLWVVMGWTNR